LEEQWKADARGWLPWSRDAAGILCQIRILAGTDFRLDAEFGGNGLDAIIDIASARYGHRLDRTVVGMNVHWAARGESGHELQELWRGKMPADYVPFVVEGSVAA